MCPQVTVKRAVTHVSGVCTGHIGGAVLGGVHQLYVHGGVQQGTHGVPTGWPYYPWLVPGRCQSVAVIPGRLSIVMSKTQALYRFSQTVQLCPDCPTVSRLSNGVQTVQRCPDCPNGGPLVVQSMSLVGGLRCLSVFLPFYPFYVRSVQPSVDVRQRAAVTHGRRLHVGTPKLSGINWSKTVYGSISYQRCTTGLSCRLSLVQVSFTRCFRQTVPNWLNCTVPLGEVQLHHGQHSVVMAQLGRQGLVYGRFS